MGSDYSRKSYDLYNVRAPYRQRVVWLGLLVMVAGFGLLVAILSRVLGCSRAPLVPAPCGSAAWLIGLAFALTVVGGYTANWGIYGPGRWFRRDSAV